MNERYQAPTDWFIEGEIYDVVKAKAADGSALTLAHVDPGCVLHPDACAEAARMMAAAPKALRELRAFVAYHDQPYATEDLSAIVERAAAVLAEAEGRVKPAKP